MRREIDLNLLIVFDAVMSERNLRRAGERLFRSQPAISQSIGRLRHITGDRLFDKVPTGIEPTARAEVLWGEIRAPLAQLRRTMGNTEFDPSSLVGELVLGFSDDARITLWPSIAESILSMAPNVTLRLVDVDHTNVWQGLKSGTFDLAVTVTGQPPPGMGARIAHQDEFVLLQRADRKPPKTPQQYAALNHLAIVFSVEQPAYADEALEASEQSRKVVARVSRFDALPDLVLKLDAVVALPSRIASHFARDDLLQITKLPVDFPPAILKLCWAAKRSAK